MLSIQPFIECNSVHFRVFSVCIKQVTVRGKILEWEKIGDFGK